MARQCRTLSHISKLRLCFLVRGRHTGFCTLEKDNTCCNQHALKRVRPEMFAPVKMLLASLLG